MKAPSPSIQDACVGNGVVVVAVCRRYGYRFDQWWSCLLYSALYLDYSATTKPVWRPVSALQL